MYKTVILCFTLFLFACNSHKGAFNKSDKRDEITDTFQTTETLKSFNLQLTIQQYNPYCGGAAPTDEMLNNYVPVSGDFILIDKKTSQESIINVKNGEIELQLKPSQYAIKESFKNVSFKEFYARYKKKDKAYYMNKNEACFKKWWNANLFEFEIKDTTTLLKLETILYGQCFTGNNPCIQYTGPYPP
jgi:hypothetical protein